MNNTSANLQIQTEFSLIELRQRIADRENQIDITCRTAMAQACNAVRLAIDQGNDLLLAKAKVSHGKWTDWLNDNFPKSPTTASGYMRLASAATLNRGFDFEDVKSIRDAFRVLNLLPEAEQKSFVSIPISPVFSKLNYIAEWVARDCETVKQWDAAMKEELKIQLRPVIELYQTL